MAIYNELTVNEITLEGGLKDASGNWTFKIGAAVPSAVSGYAIGCIFVLNTTGKTYQNEGTASSCTFNSIGDIATADIGANVITPIKMGTRTAVALADAAATPTIAQLMTSSIFAITPTQARTFTTPTAAQMVAGITGATIGSWFDFTIVNTAAFAVTLTAGAGVTLSGNAVVNKGSGTFRVVLTNVTSATEALTIYRMASGSTVADMALADGKLPLGQNTGLAGEVTPAGDVTIGATGTTAIGAKKVLTSMVNTNAITPIKMGTRTLVALADDAATPTIAQLLTSSVFTMTPTAARNFTTPTAAVIVAGITDATIGTWFDFTVVNLGNFAITVVAGDAGVTLSGNAVINKGSATYRAVLTNVTGAAEALTIYRTDSALVTEDIPLANGKYIVGDANGLGSEKTVTNANATATMVASVRSGHVHYLNPIAASANAAAATLVVDVIVADGAQIVAAQPDLPRKLLLFITDADTSISAGTLTLVGVGASGEAVTEGIVLTGGTATKTSVYAYATLTSATVASLAGNDGTDKIALGVASALALVGQKTPASSAFAVHKSDVGSANETVGTVDATAGTIVPTTVPNGTNDYDFWYTYAITEVQSAHTHTISVA